MRATEKSANPRRKQSLRGNLADRLIIILLLLAEAFTRFPQSLVVAAGSQDRRLFSFAHSPRFLVNCAHHRVKSARTFASPCDFSMV